MSTVHEHSHAHHAHDHGDAVGGRERRLLLAFALTLLMLAMEAAGGLWSGSLALLADAGHMLVDAFALLLAFLGAWLARRPADARRSYGYGRMEVLAGFVNALTQFVLVGFIAWEAVDRLLHLDRIHILSGVMLAVALAGLLVNLLVLRLLHGHAHDDVNMGAASLHVLGDLFGSLGAVLAAMAVRWLDWNWADPLLSLLVSLLILGGAWRLLRRSAHILLEGAPEGLDPAEVTAVLRGADASIRDVHHLHVWQLASGSRMATLHVELHEGSEGAAALGAIRRVLDERFGIRHVTVQIDPAGCPDGHHDCGDHAHH
ncbi:cation diffusion facilitator family transporter [Fulvimonas sp. R45]|uniref:cation diffusion facilitator family transporter n=1 Tax=Fulvimonas sp. R45 TaxID=3045937 RepID=UPI00265E872E|nr:cation diffusion facilitator family transporter [Fulvimonas sp. R45]MDO1528600.1 cation diffusion facilitator family transporter [Fulvimonas sp. R45]